MARTFAWAALSLAAAACQVANPAFEGAVAKIDAGTAGAAASLDASAGAGGAATVLGLVGFWRFDEGAGTSARDSSGHGNHGNLKALPAAPWVPGRTGGWALDFGSGVDARVEVPSSASLDSITSGVTIAAWTYPTGAPTGQFRVVLSRQRAGTDRELYGLGIVDTELGMYLTGETSDTGPRATVTLPLAKWTHLAATYDGSVARLYVGGQEVIREALATRTFGADTTPLAIGNNSGVLGYKEGWVGRIDDVLLYSRALSADEIAALATGAVPRP